MFLCQIRLWERSFYQNTDLRKRTLSAHHGVFVTWMCVNYFAGVVDITPVTSSFWMPYQES